MPLCIFTLENKKYYIKQYQQDLIDSITNMVEKLNNPELFLNTLKPTVQNISWIIENPIISYKIVNTEKLEDMTVQLMKQFGMQSTRSDLCPNAYINFEESEYLRGRINEEEQPVMDRIAILDGQIEVLKDVNIKLDRESVIKNKYANYNIFGYQHLLTQYEIAILRDFHNNSYRNDLIKINLVDNKSIDNFLDNFEKYILLPQMKNRFKAANDSEINISEIKDKLFNNSFVLQERIEAKTAKIKYDKLVNKYGDKKSIEESLQDLLTKKLKLIDSDEYKNIDIF
jgi:hypothetical protein